MTDGNREGPDLGVLMERGLVTENMSPSEIAVIVSQYESGNPDPKLPVVQEPAPAAQVVTQEPKPEAAAATAAQATAAAATPEPEGPIATGGGATIPYAVLKNTRADRDRWQQQAQEAAAALEKLQREHSAQIADLQAKVTNQQGAPSAAQVAKVQDLANKAGFTDENGNPVDVTTIDITQYRGAFPDELVNLIGALQHEVVGLRNDNASRIRVEQTQAKDQEQLDIDSVPQVAAWQAAQDGGVMWNAVTATYGALRQQEAWKTKTRPEVLTEVARLLGGASQASTPTNTTTVTPGTKAAAAIEAARSTHVPLSHSDLPTGSPAAQSEVQALDQLSPTQLAARLETMSPAQQEAFLAKFG